MAMNTSYFDPPINMDRVCRICLVESTNLSSIFRNDQQEVNDFSGLLEKIQLCGSIEIHENDGFPSLICDACIYNVRIAHKFRQQCQQSDARLRLIYDKPSRTTDITIRDTFENQDNIEETCTQTEPQTRIILKRKMATPPSAYCVKEELESSSNRQAYATTIEAYTVPAGHHCQEEVITRQEPMDCAEDEENFLCDIGYEAMKNITEKSTTESSMDLSTVDHHQQQHHHQMELPLKQVELKTTSLVTANAADELLETRELIIKEDDENVLASENDDAAEYWNEQLLNSNTVDDCIAPDPVDFEDQRQKAMIMEQPDLSSFNEKDKSLKIDDDDKVGDNSDSEDVCGGGAEDDSYVASLSAEAEEKIDVPSYKCNVCPKSYTTEKALADHNLEHEKNYKCEICQKLFSTRKNMERHRKFHEEKRNACSECQASFSRLSDLTRHVKNQHCEKITKLAETSESCANEERTSRLEDSATECDTTNDNEEFIGPRVIYKCEVCGQFYSSPKSLKLHSVVHGEKKYSCEICKKSFFRAYSLKKHTEKHGQEKREYRCDICSKAYPNSSSLTYHMRTHTGVKPHICNICNNGFTTTTSLANHMRIHTGDKPFVCHVCSAAFAVNSAFRRHLRCHTGEPDYECKTCGKAFKRHESLKEHLYKHSGEKPYVCKSCGVAYSHSGSLLAHEKRCRPQYGEIGDKQQQHHTVAHHKHVNNAKISVRSLSVIGQMY